MSEISLPQQEQAQKLAEIGDYLRQVREQHDLTLEQMAGKTLIQARLLRAIESGNLQPLPEPVYIRGFIKRYSEALGLDGGEISDAFPIENSIQAVQPTWKDSPAAQLRPLHLWVAYIVLIVAAVSGLSYVISRSSFTGKAPQTASAVAPASRPAASRPAASSSAARPSGAAASSTATPSPAASPSPTTSPAVADLPVRVDMTLTAQSWVRVEVDGKNVFQGMLLEGTQRTWTAKQSVTVRAGNAGGVSIAYNNGQPQPMGAPGAVKETTYAPGESAASLPASPASPLPQ